MEHTTLGRTGLRVSRLAFGAGPVPDLMTAEDQQRQWSVVRRALELGVNWFDTAATYGDGRSEESLGRALANAPEHEFHLASKVRVAPEQTDGIEAAVRASVEGSLRRLGVERLTLLQLHNSITRERGDEPTSLTPEDVLGPVLREMRRLREAGVVSFLGLTGIGQADALKQVIDSGQFDTIQTPYNLANPSAGRDVGDRFSETNYGNLIQACAEQGMGVLAIRVFAAGALLNLPPSAHTHKTKFFPLDLYRRDLVRAQRFEQILDGAMSVKEAALRFPISHAHVSSAIVGMSAPEHVDEAVKYLDRGPLPDILLSQILAY